MRIDVVTIFPEYLDPVRLSLIGRAVDTGVLEVHVHDLRGWTHDRHRTVDDTPYGGGPGMVMSPVPWGEALDDIRARAPERIPLLVIPTPSGVPFTQGVAVELSRTGSSSPAGATRASTRASRSITPIARTGPASPSCRSATTCSPGARPPHW